MTFDEVIRNSMSNVETNKTMKNPDISIPRRFDKY